MTVQPDPAVASAEAWFVAHGLPYFVHGHNREVRDALRPSRLVPVALTAVALAGVSGVAVGWWRADPSSAVAVGSAVLGLVVLGYALAALKVGSIMRWAARRTFGSLSWVFPLVTRALPMLLLFITFLFINAEVWQVASTLDRGLLWMTVLLFAAVAVVFLLVRLPEEVRAVRDDARGERLRTLAAGTPMESLVPRVADEAGLVPLGPLQRANLVLVLLFAQVLQVTVLSLAVFAFFLVFGNLAIDAEVVESWVGEGHPTDLPSLGWLPMTNELFQVSTFLAAFSGLYFTVYAVTDQTYRDQFFATVSRDLERAVGVATVYRTLLRLPPDNAG